MEARTAKPPPRRVLVTGGAMRLGAALCEIFAGAGWEVICHYRNGQTQAQALCDQLRDRGLLASAIYADLAQNTECTGLMETIQDEYGPLDCLVNNASLFIADNGASKLT